MKLWWSIFLLLTVGTSDASLFEKNNVYVKSNSYPILISAISNFVPLFNGKYDNQYMELICSLAFGNINQKDVNDSLKKYISNFDSLAAKDNGFKILTSENKVAKVVACAAYILSTSNRMPDISRFAIENNNNKTINVDDKSLIALMSARLSIAKANANILSAIASNMDNDNEIKNNETNELISKLFSKNAQSYIDNIKKYKNQQEKSNYYLIRFQADNLFYRDGDGYAVEINNTGLHLYWFGVPWLSEGKIMGVEYFIKKPLEFD